MLPIVIDLLRKIIENCILNSLLTSQECKHNDYLIKLTIIGVFLLLSQSNRLSELHVFLTFTR